MKLLITCAFLVLLTAVHCIDESINSKVLVLLEDLSIRGSHSLFLNSLKDNGYDITYKFADDSSLSLTKFGEYTYKHIIIFAPSTREFGGKVDVRSITDFIDAGGNVIVTGGPDIGEAIRELGVECGIEFDSDNTYVIDHFNYDKRDTGKHTLLSVNADNLAPVPVITGSKKYSPFLYRGIGISSNVNNPLLIPLLNAGSTSYSYNPDAPVNDYPNTLGRNTNLIVAMQARNNARAVFSGSLEFFSNDFFTASILHESSGTSHKETGNKQLSENLSKWVLGETGALRFSDVKHHRKGETKPPKEYTIKEDVSYSIKIETKNAAGKWVPFEANDVQLEVVRIDPFIRATLKRQNGRYYTDFKLPDVYGVFKYQVDYKRPGYDHIKSVSQVSVRPYTHLEYERFIVPAYPYYASAFSMLIGLVLFSIVFLYFREETEKIQKK